MRVRTSGCSGCPIQANMVFCTIMKAARPQAKDMMMNIGASMADWYA